MATFNMVSDMTSCLTIMSFIFFFLTFTLAENNNIKIEHITVEDGLSNNFCYCTIQDKEGFIWFGTEDGLNRWDGSVFKVFKNNPDDSSTISNSKIYAISEDSEGDLWISTGYGLNRYNKSTENFKRYFFVDTTISVPHANTIGPVVEDSADIFWIGTRVGLVKFNKKTGQYKRFVPQPENLDFSLMGSNYLIWLYKINENELLVGSAGGILKFEVSSNQFSRITPLIKNKKDERRRPVADAIKPYIDKEGNLWVQTIEGGVHKYNLKKQELSPFTELHQNTGISTLAVIWSVCRDKSGMVWLTTVGNGLFHINLDKKSTYQYMPDPGNTNTLSSRWLSSVYIDNQGIIWVATFDKGINKITILDRKVTIYKSDSKTNKSPPAGEIMDMCFDNGGWLWLASIPGGAAKFNIKKQEFVHIPYMTGKPDATIDRRIPALLKDKSGIIWLGTFGLERYDSKQNTFTHFLHNPKDNNSLSDNTIITMIEDKHGFIWCGMRGTGLDRFDREKNTFKHYRHNPADTNSLCNDIVWIIQQDYKGFLWLGTENGLSRLEFSDDGSPIFTTYKHHRGRHNSLTNNFVYSVFEDSQKRLWIGTERGLNLYNRSDHVFSSFPQIEQIHTNKIFCIIEDEHSNLWLRTNIGLIRFNPDTKKTRLFNEKDGLKDCRSIAYGYQGFTRGQDGVFYYGAPQSLMIFHPDSLETKKKPPDVVLSELSLNYKPVEAGMRSPLKKALHYTERINLDHKQKNLTIQFGVLDYLDAGKIQYAYKMSKVNEEWVYCGNQRIAPYTNLDPGRYIFQVKASYNNEDWTKPVRSLIIVITPPWWETWWAFLIYITIFSTIVFTVFRFETSRREMMHRATVAELQAKTSEAQKEVEKEQMRVRIANDLHDEVGSNLSSIAITGEVLEKRLTLAEADTKRLQKIRHIAYKTTDSIRDIVWFINPENDGIDKLIAKMRETANTMLELVTLDFSVKMGKRAITMDVNFRRNLYLIYKEILQNVIRHSQSTQVKINIGVENHELVINVFDNGIGFDPEKKYNGNGLKNFRYRASEMEGQLVIQSTPQKGTSVRLSAKIP